MTLFNTYVSIIYFYLYLCKLRTEFFEEKKSVGFFLKKKTLKIKLLKFLEGEAIYENQYLLFVMCSLTAFLTKLNHCFYFPPGTHDDTLDIAVPMNFPTAFAAVVTIPSVLCL